jgi:redox-sensitive bicupin YhaK (pirin superfamily)
MITIRPAAERGHRDHGWLDTRHTFSFDDYHDPAHMGFQTLRVINEDRVRPGEGFGTHPHQDMEIVTWVLEGALQHRDSMGNGSVIRPGDVQRMSAGTGVTHSEFNASDRESVHFLQIWIAPSQRGLEPSYEQISVAAADLRGQFRLVASPDGRDGSVTVHQDAELYVGAPESGGELVHALPAVRHAWLQVARGAVRLNGHALTAGDGASVSDERRLEISAREPSEVLLFSLGSSFRRSLAS